MSADNNGPYRIQTGNGSAPGGGYRASSYRQSLLNIMNHNNQQSLQPGSVRQNHRSTYRKSSHPHLTSPNTPHSAATASTPFLDKPSSLSRPPAAPAPEPSLWEKWFPPDKTPSEWLNEIFPIIDQVRNYNTSFLIADLLSGLTICFVLIPQALAFSGLAKQKPIRALVSAVFPLYVYAILGSSKQLALGPEALSSVLVGVAIEQEMEFSKDVDPGMLAGVITLIVGLFTILLSIIQAGFIDNILSGFLLTGFVLGISNLIMVEQIPPLLGLDHKVTHVSGEASTFEKYVACFKGFSTAHLPSAVVGLWSLVFLLSMKFIKKRFGHDYPWVVRIPEILVLVVMSVIFSWAMGFEGIGIHTLGKFDNALLPLSFPALDVAQVSRIFSSVVTITIVGFIESQTVTKSFGLKKGYFPSGDKELFALGSANLFAAVTGGYVTFGSLPRSRIQFNSGGQTMLTGVFAATFVLLLFSFAASILQFLPKPALAAIVFNAAINLIEYDEIFFVFEMKNYIDIAMFITTWGMTMFISIASGILLCLLLSVLIIVKRNTTVQLSLLGVLATRDPSSGRMLKYEFVDVEDYPEAELVDDCLILQVQGPLLFYNSGRIRRTIELLANTDKAQAAVSLEGEDHGHGHGGDHHGGDQDKLDFDAKGNVISNHHDMEHGHSSSGNSCVILDLSNCNEMDAAAVLILRRIAKSFKHKGIRMAFTGLAPEQKKLFVNGGMVTLLGRPNFSSSVESFVRREGLKIH